MNEIALKKYSVKKKSLQLTFYVLFSLLVVENVFAYNYWKKDLVQVSGSTRQNYIEIKTIFYNYSYGKRYNECAYLESCRFEASADGNKFYSLMEISTKRQDYSSNNTTTLNFKNKIEGDYIEFINNVFDPSIGTIWSEELKSKIKVKVHNNGKLAQVSVRWWYGDKIVRFIQVSGKYTINADVQDDIFKKIVYKIKNFAHIQSNTPDIYTKMPENDTVNVFKDSEAIVIKGADLGANIKVYTTSGVEIKSVISNNDEVKIIPPAKQIYIVHIGNSRYKVAM